MADTPRPPGVLDLERERLAIDAALDQAGAELLDGVAPEIADAIRYSLGGRGKRLRGILLSFSYRAAGGTGDTAPLAAAVEIVHAYSLVHDDLPCMDDDDMRRGRPTTHKQYGTRVAALAGLAMIPFAVRCAVAADRQLQLGAATTGRVVETLMRAAGAGGMIGGQWRDLRAERETLTLDAMESLHRAKTGALIAAAARIGGLAAGAPEFLLRALTQYGTDLGLAFQIIDDVLDITATTTQLGKTVGRDVVLCKSTYPGLLGEQGAIRRAHELVRSGCRALTDVDERLPTEELRELANVVVHRRS